MDLMTPPLTRSPTSPPNTYCPCEASSSGHHSPHLVEQNYRISSIYGPDPNCSMDPELSLPSLDATSQAGDYSSSSSATSSSAMAMPGILAPGYEQFAGPYDDPLSGPYSNDVYAGQTSHDHHSHYHHDHDLTHSPPQAALPRASLPYHSNPTTPRLKIEEPLEYGYPSPHSVHTAPYPTDMHSYPPPPSAGYPSDGQSAESWTKPEVYHIEPDQLYPGTPGHSHSMPMFDASSSQQNGRSSARLASRDRPRRPSRKLTTKEDANYQCECGKLFSRSYNYKAHMETHDEKREYKFPCPVSDCDKKFVRKTDLTRHHQSVHIKERNHKCQFCDRAFSRRDTLNRHMDDGCPNRFNIASLELQAQGYDQGGLRSLSQHGPSNATLPPLTMAVSPPLRGREHSWGR